MLPSNVTEMRQRLRDAGYDIPYTDKTKNGYSLKIWGPRVLAHKGDTETKDVKRAEKKAQKLSEQVALVVGKDAETKLVRTYSCGYGYQFNVRVIVKAA